LLLEPTKLRSVTCLLKVSVEVAAAGHPCRRLTVDEVRRCWKPPPDHLHDVGMPADRSGLKNAWYLAGRRRWTWLASADVPRRGRCRDARDRLSSDTVDESNLQRQIIHGRAIGRSKAESA
jgi:hypothetical protein